MLFMMIVKASKNTENSQSSTEWGMIHPRDAGLCALSSI
jgi:hypothetical protein